jgi:hypothetical protein
MTSLMSTSSRFEAPFLKSRRIRLMISAARFVEIRGVARQPAQAGVGVGDRTRERLVDLVGDRGRQLSQEGHAGDPLQLRPGIAQRLFDLVPFGDLRLQRRIGRSQLVRADPQFGHQVTDH